MTRSEIQFVMSDDTLSEAGPGLYSGLEITQSDPGGLLSPPRPRHDLLQIQSVQLHPTAAQPTTLRQIFSKLKIFLVKKINK